MGSDNRDEETHLISTQGATISCEENLGMFSIGNYLNLRTIFFKLMKQSKHKSLVDVATNGTCQGAVSLKPR
jgi:hypothetical protein